MVLFLCLDNCIPGCGTMGCIVWWREHTSICTCFLECLLPLLLLFLLCQLSPAIPPTNLLVFILVDFSTSTFVNDRYDAPAPFTKRLPRVHLVFVLTGTYSNSLDIPQFLGSLPHLECKKLNCYWRACTYDGISRYCIFLWIIKLVFFFW